ncbi:hypothetical protein PAEPH01_0679 [Pancytospora epiphaga]|nr:hypothetical protein PAEPH01_0679 [Pancytospora epiphaga]
MSEQKHEDNLLEIRVTLQKGSAIDGTTKDKETNEELLSENLPTVIGKVKDMEITNDVEMTLNTMNTKESNPSDPENLAPVNRSEISQKLKNFNFSPILEYFDGFKRELNNVLTSTFNDLPTSESYSLLLSCVAIHGDKSLEYLKALSKNRRNKILNMFSINSTWYLGNLQVLLVNMVTFRYFWWTYCVKRTHPGFLA